jgi:hypothetical protein
MPAGAAGKEPPNRPDEPFAKDFSLTRTATFMDVRAPSWTREHHCGSCHTNYPCLMARPALKGPPSPAFKEVRHLFEDRAGQWDIRHEAARPGDRRHTCANTGRLARRLGWQPRIGYDEGLTRQVAWQQAHG